MDLAEIWIADRRIDSEATDSHDSSWPNRSESPRHATKSVLDTAGFGSRYA